MCGLFASIGIAPDPARLDIIAHRGPDGRGWETFASPAGPVALGHRRLAIIDTSDAGLQPMADPSGRFRLIFNGEIYNYRELRAELEAKGEAFRTASDSEVLLRAFLIWGEDVLPRLRGMFAFLIWDDRDKTLFAARDRFGIKPLYIAQCREGLAFASEIKQLLGEPFDTARINVARAHDYLASGLTDHTAQTLFAGVTQLRGGELARVTCAPAGPRIEVRRWASIDSQMAPIGEKEAVEAFRAALIESMRLHLRADVPVGSCLSGGLDSSSIVCLMARLEPQADLHTISATYPNTSVDERPFMEAVVAQTGARAHYVTPTPDELIERLSALIWHQDEPFGSTSIFAQWRVFEEARKVGVKVMLDGQGADEQLAGYHSAFPYRVAEIMRGGRPDHALKLMLARRDAHGASLMGQMARLAPLLAPEAAAEPLRKLHLRAVGRDLFDAPLIRAEGNREGPLTAAAASLGLRRPRDVAQLCVCMTYASNLQMLLHWEDRNSMAHSIEARVPFLDPELVALSLSLPTPLKIDGVETKSVLRRAMADILPAKVRDRRDKLGFATPEPEWMRGGLKTILAQGVETTLSRLPGLVDPKAARAMTTAMLSGARPADPALWRLANLGLWSQRFQTGT